MLRSAAVQLGLLPKLWCEDDIVSSPAAMPVDEIEDGLLRSCNVARTACSKFLTQVDGATLKAELVCRQPYLIQTY
eukprot:10740116-Prorocentrum_lima.AAC.1